MQCVKCAGESLTGAGCEIQPKMNGPSKLASPARAQQAEEAVSRTADLRRACEVTQAATATQIAQARARNINISRDSSALQAFSLCPLCS